MFSIKNMPEEKHLLNEAPPTCKYVHIPVSMPHRAYVGLLLLQPPFIFYLQEHRRLLPEYGINKSTQSLDSKSISVNSVDKKTSTDIVVKKLTIITTIEKGVDHSALLFSDNKYTFYFYSTWVRTLSTLHEAQHQEVSTVRFFHQETLWSSTRVCNRFTRVFIVQIKVSICWWNFIRSSCQRSYRGGGSFGVGLKYNPT